MSETCRAALPPDKNTGGYPGGFDCLPFLAQALLLTHIGSASLLGIFYWISYWLITHRWVWVEEPAVTTDNSLHNRIEWADFPTELYRYLPTTDVRLGRVHLTEVQRDEWNSAGTKQLLSTYIHRCPLRESWLSVEIRFWIVGLNLVDGMITAQMDEH